MVNQLAIQTLSVRQFRNISCVEFEPTPRLNVLAGDNGQGKTSLLEAVYFVATSRSFRTERLRELVRQGEASGVVQACIVEDGLPREQRAAILSGRRSLKLDGKTPDTLANYATRTPVIVFHPGDLILAGGPPNLRRTLLDRISLYFEASALAHRVRYLKALKERQQVLNERGSKARELEIFETLMAQHGSQMQASRRRAAERLKTALHPAFHRMAAADLELGVEYEPGGSEDAAEFFKQLEQHRVADMRAKRPGFGPQKDELALTIDGRSVRKHASQGQLRILSLALKLAELDCIRDARSAHPILLLDDVSSELDPARTGAVYDFVREAVCQVFVTTTRPSLFTTPQIGPDERRDWRLVKGALEPQASPG